MEDVTAGGSGVEAPDVRTIGTGQAFKWLGSGLQDLKSAPLQSGFYGIVFAVVGYLALGLLGQLPYLVTAMISGFLLLAPFLAIGLYRISQQLEAGQRPRLGDSMTAWRRNYGSIGLFAAFLGFAFIFWERISAILFALFHGLNVPEVDDLGGWIFLLSEDPIFLVLYVGLGAIAAAIVFACSVVSIPLMLDRHIDPVTALITSVRATLKNRLALAVWAVTIVVLVAIGIATWFVGLVVIMPILGHASWHAYRDLVQTDVHDPMYQRSRPERAIRPASTLLQFVARMQAKPQSGLAATFPGFRFAPSGLRTARARGRHSPRFTINPGAHPPRPTCTTQAGTDAGRNAPPTSTACAGFRSGG